MSNLALRKGCLFDEIDTSIKLLKKGMGELQSIDGANDFYHVPILLLANGFERLLKCLLCLAKMDQNGNFAQRPFNRLHDLDYLLSELLAVCNEKNYSTKFPAAAVDIQFLSSNQRLREIISILSNFAQSGRYYNLDIVTTGTSSFDDPEDGWSKVELAIINERPDLKQLMDSPTDSDLLFEEINREFIVYLERFARALSRLFTLADFGSQAKRFSGLVTDFLCLPDSQLGRTRY